MPPFAPSPLLAVFALPSAESPSPGVLPVCPVLPGKSPRPPSLPDDPLDALASLPVDDEPLEPEDWPEDELDEELLELDGLPELPADEGEDGDELGMLGDDGEEGALELAQPLTKTQAQTSTNRAIRVREGRICGSALFEVISFYYFFSDLWHTFDKPRTKSCALE